MTRPLTIAQGRAAFDVIDLAYGPQDGAMEALDDVRLSYVGRRSGAPCGGAMLVAPIGCGKTRTVEMLAARVEASCGLPSGSKPVLLVQTPTEGTTGSIPTALLRALGYPRPDLGRAELRWSKALRLMVDANVQLVVFDEFNRTHRNPTMSRPIATSIRERIMDSGVAPVAIVGSREADLVLKSCPELAQRLDDRIPLEPMAWYDDQDRGIFLELLRDLDLAMIDAGLVRSSNLAAEATAELLAEASSGTIRSLMKIVRSALGPCIARGGDRITHDDLGEATEAIAVASGFIASNPFGRCS
jgi:hypothetical protein